MKEGRKKERKLKEKREEIPIAQGIGGEGRGRRLQNSKKHQKQ
jgi:hypothetical protein